jgi:hypothetical protein
MVASTAALAALRTAAKTSRSYRNFTSVLAGCTFTSTNSGGSDRYTTQMGWRPTIKCVW